eukprot:TRINITY_DN13021_c0_g1_i1.p1 TRINITY_DN13021_c0_g1~~TRINITY_DN13021_c0_g1_i1.p1  ORF type:complete len:110 (+),score=13.17 TRINITY_DN13021_c0_g1_i1:25-354(+)
MKGSLQAFRRGLSRMAASNTTRRASKLQAAADQQKSHQNWNSQQSNGSAGLAKATGAFIASLASNPQRSVQASEQKQFSSNRVGVLVASAALTDSVFWWLVAALLDDGN